MIQAADAKPTCEDLLGIRFHNSDLLIQALTHSSFVNEYSGDQAIADNERLEFLGDAILDLIVADMLYHKYPDVSEGELTQLRAALVKTESLARIGISFRLGDFLRIGRGEENTGGRGRMTILCQGFEAVIGAMYLDRGLKTVVDFVMPSLLELLDYILENSLHIDARSELQERIQAKLSITPSYRVAGADGPDHAKEFRVEAALGDTIIGSGSGASKRLAAQDAARAALEYLERAGLPDSVEFTAIEISASDAPVSRVCQNNSRCRCESDDGSA